jgi:uncharacterized protein YijF (DUF1287 family)
MKRAVFVLVLLAVVIAAAAWKRAQNLIVRALPVRPVHSAQSGHAAITFVAPETLSPFQAKVVADLSRQCASRIWYQDGYYSGGDPPPKIGVCTDVVIRSFRAGGVDLQSLVHADIVRSPEAYGIDRPDPNIDHRRCRNLDVFFGRHAKRLPISGTHADWEPGDIVFWDTGNGGRVNHVGVIANGRIESGEPTVVHHWPGNYVMETDWLYRLPIVHHFRYIPQTVSRSRASNGTVIYNGASFRNLIDT